MSRYFFRVVDGNREMDIEGFEPPNDETAQRVAVRFCGGLLQRTTTDVWSNGQCRVEVADERGVHRWSIMAIGIDASLQEDTPAAT